MFHCFILEKLNDHVFCFLFFFPSSQKKSVIVTSLIVVVSLFLVVINYSEKPYFLLQPVFGQSFNRNWMFSRPPHKAFKPHRGYLSVPNQEVRLEQSTLKIFSVLALHF